MFRNTLFKRNIFYRSLFIYRDFTDLKTFEQYLSKYEKLFIIYLSYKIYISYKISR